MLPLLCSRQIAVPVILAALAIGRFACCDCVEAGAPEATDLSKIVTFADNLIEHGRDRYGQQQTPLFVSQLDIRTKHIPPADTTFYGKGGRGGAGPTTNNLQFDSGLIRLLDALTRLTGDAKYSRAVDDYLRYYFQALPDPKTGFFPWGDHRGYDLVKDETIKAVHEFKVIYPPWQRYWDVNPRAVRKEIESLKLHIYDESKSWAYSRHYPSSHAVPHSMPSSGGAWIVAWSFLHKQTGEDRYLAWATKMADYFWSVRDANTDLLASHPADPAYPEYKNYEGGLRATRTEYMTQLTTLAPHLLIAAELLGDEKGKKLRRQALAYIRAFTSRMEVGDDGSFYPTFELATGKPLFPRITDGWRFIPQMNEKYRWANRVLGIRAPIALAFAFKKTGETDLRRDFDKLLPLYRIEEFGEDAKRKELPAGLIAQAVVSFLNMYQATGEKPYLQRAETFGRYATKHYYQGGWYVCGPALLERYQDKRLDTWNMYSNRGGSAQLALALLRLHQICQSKPDPVDDNPMCYF